VATAVQEWMVRVMSDYIKREDALEQFDYYDLGEYLTTQIRDMLMDIPSADVAPIRHGHWIYDQCDIVCSECGTAFSDEVCYMMRSDVSYHEPRHCLWCGARMEEDTK
jgi:hypothetical protein